MRKGRGRLRHTLTLVVLVPRCRRDEGLLKWVLDKLLLCRTDLADDNAAIGLLLL